MIEINQFSTGIQYEKTTDGGWVSRGFTGQFINITLDPIPEAILKAISNKEFAIAEGTVTEKPALIGREVRHNGQTWSVLAVIIQAVDDFGRNFPAYRYFYTEGRGNLERLVRWWIAENSPIFNPFEQVEVIFYEPDSDIEIPLTNFQELLSGSAPIVITEHQQCSPLILNRIADKIASQNDVAWAYNVGGLDYPKSFHIIYPSSPEAGELIAQVIRSKPASVGLIKGEHGLKLAIQNLMNREEISVEYLETLEIALTDSQIDDKLWKSLFDGKGAREAISQEMYNSNMVRLLTLQAIILPLTLPDFLSWLQNRSKEKTHYETSLKFQYEIVKKIGRKAPKIADKVSEGVNLIILELLHQPDLLESTIWLLGSNQSIWANLYHFDLKKQIDHDLSLMMDFGKGKKDVKFHLVPQWQPIWNQIKGFWRLADASPLSQYLPIAELFDHLADYKYSAVFYQISQGSVPKAVFTKVTGNSYKCTLYKLKIEKYVSKLELVWLALIKIGGRIVPVYLVVPLIILVFLLGGITGRVTSEKKAEVENSANSPSPSDFSSTKPKFKLDMKIAEAKIPKTYAALQELIKPDGKTEKIINILNQSLLGNVKLKIEDLDQPDFGDAKTQKNWINAIFVYQKQNKLQSDGTIEKNGETFNKLKADINKPSPKK